MNLLLFAAEGGSNGQLIEAFKHNPTFMVANLCCSAIVLTIVAQFVVWAQFAGWTMPRRSSAPR